MIHYISIGPYCAAAGILEDCQRRHQAFPFDYIFSSLPMIRHILTDRCDRLLGLMDKHEKIVFVYFNPYIDDHCDLFKFADSFRDCPTIRIVGIADNHSKKNILHHGINCKVYQHYDREEMFRDIEQSF